MWLANPHPILQGGPLFSRAKAVFIPPAELVVFLRLSTQEKPPGRPDGCPGGFCVFAGGQSMTVRVRPMPTTAAVSFFQVLQPQMPSTDRPTERWKPRRALSVLGPNLPSSVRVE